MTILTLNKKELEKKVGKITTFKLLDDFYLYEIMKGGRFKYL